MTPDMTDTATETVERHRPARSADGDAPEGMPLKTADVYRGQIHAPVSTTMPVHTDIAGATVPGAVTAALVGIATIVGLYVRLVHLLPADFPFNDGGLFFLMAEELRANHYALPVFTSYNHAGIPFAYPPLGLYVAAILADTTGWPLIDIVRLFPPVVGAMSIPVMYLLSRALLAARPGTRSSLSFATSGAEHTVQAITATFAFALTPAELGWPIMGGGITRAPALLFAMLALHQLCLLYAKGRIKYLPGALAFSGLTMLSHPQVALFLACSAALLLLYYGRERLPRSLMYSTVVAAGALLLTSPWWVTVASRHGFSPFLSASQTGLQSWNVLLDLLYFTVVPEPLLSIWGVLALLGVFACVVRREWLWPVWVITAMIVTPRTGSAYAAIPVSVLVAYALSLIIWPALAALQTRVDAHGGDTRGGEHEGPLRVGWPSTRPAKAFMGYMLAYGLLSAYIAPVANGAPLNTLTAEQRQAMHWVAGNTPADSIFLVITAVPPGQDAASEWFPVLTDRVSAATTQGYEWLPEPWRARLSAASQLQKCAYQDVSCLQKWAQDNHRTFNYVYLSKPGSAQGHTCCPALELSLNMSQDYRVVYEGPGALIYARRQMATGGTEGPGTPVSFGGNGPPLMSIRTGR